VRQSGFEASQNSSAVVADLAARYGHHFDVFCLQFSNFQPVALEGDSP